MLPPVPKTQELRSKLDRAVGMREGVQRRLDDTQAEIRRFEDEEEKLELVANVFRQMIDMEITEGVQAVEKLLSEGLASVFDDQDLWVEANVEVQRGKVSVDLITKQRQPNGTVIDGSSSDAFGGAVTTVQSALLRIIVLLRREMRPLLLLDESLPAFDAHYVHNMSRFLSLLCKRLGMDILLVSHNPALVEAADKAYTIQIKDDASVFKEAR